MHPCTIRQVHFIARLYHKGVVEGWYIGQRAVHAELGRSMHVCNDLAGKLLVPDLVHPSKCVPEEKPLHRRQAGNLLSFLKYVCLLEGVDTQQQSAQVREVFTQTCTTVD